MGGRGSTVNVLLTTSHIVVVCWYSEFEISLVKMSNGLWRSGSLIVIRDVGTTTDRAHRNARDASAVLGYYYVHILTCNRLKDICSANKFKGRDNL